MTSAPLRAPGDLLRRAAADRPERVALRADGRTLTWADLDRAVSAAAAGFVAAGLVPGDRLVLAHPTSLRMVVDHLGALRAGVVSCPVNPDLTGPELAHVLTDCDAAAVVTCRPDLPVPDGAGRAVVRHVPAEVTVPDPDAAPPDPGLDRRGEEVAVLLYTSGTSGRPRGAMLSARALLANVDQVAAVDPPLLTADDVVLLTVPLFHVFGLNAGLGGVLRHGASAVLVDRFDARATADLVRDGGVTVVVGAPPMYAAWAAVDVPRRAFAGVRLALSGAAPLPAALVRDYAAHGVALYEGYGMTETAPVLTCNAVGPAPGVRPDPVPGSIGRELPGVEVRIVDPTGDAVDDGDPGQLTVRGDNLFSGYWPDGRDGPVDGWFATGDIAVRGDDGGLRLVGRTTDLVIVNGFNVYPAEVEAVLGALDGVAEVAVVGEPDPRTGEAVVAHVVPSPGATLDPVDLAARAARSLARYKVPARITVAEALPHTVTGKVQKWRLVGSAALPDDGGGAGA